jgi:hypothetical protein
MKKVVRMLGLCALVALAFTACKKNDTQKVTFTANVPQTTCDSRTQPAYGAYLVWNDNDEIQVFNQAGEEMDFTAQSSEGLPGNALFTAATAEEIEFVKDLENAEKPYAAFYPNATVNADDNVELVIPAEQTYVEQKGFANGLYPMVGFNEGTKQFNFESKAGMLVVSFHTLSEGEVLYVDEVVVTTNADDDYLAGTYVYDKDGTYVDFIGESNEVVLRSDEDLEIIYSMSREFTFVLPEGALESGFTVQVKYHGDVLETYVAQPRPQNIISAQNYTVMISMPLPNIPEPTK